MGSCASLPASVTVTESAPPVLTGITIAETSGLTNDDGAICKLDDVTLTAEPSGLPGTYSWSSGGSTSSITVSPGSTTTYSVTYSEGGCTSAALSETITVSNLPSTNYDATLQMDVSSRHLIRIFRQIIQPLLLVQFHGNFLGVAQVLVQEMGQLL